MKLQAELAEYDAIRATQSPDIIVKALSSAEQIVYDAATNNKLSLDAVTEFLSGLISDINTLKSDYEEVAKKTASAMSAASSLVK